MRGPLLPRLWSVKERTLAPRRMGVGFLEEEVLEAGSSGGEMMSYLELSITS